MTTAFDLGIPDAQAAAESGIDVPIMDPKTKLETALMNAVGEPLVITIVGQDAATVRAKGNTQLNRYFERQRKGVDVSATAEESREEVIEKLAVATRRWNFKTPDGAQVPCTEANAKAIYGDPRYPYLVEQLTKVAGDRSRFFGSSSASSSSSSAGTPSSGA